MDIKEWQAKRLFSDYSVPVLPGRLVKSPKEARQAALQLAAGETGSKSAKQALPSSGLGAGEASRFAVKAQILAGGRGKAGGIKIVEGPEEVEKAAKALLQSRLITPQTSAKGEIVTELLVESACEIEKEFYLSFLVDPSCSQVSLMACAEGGMDIEKLSLTQPEKILKIPLRPDIGFSVWHARETALFLGLSEASLRLFTALCQNLYKLFWEKDASLIEINPLAVTPKGLFALDGKMSFDENAVFRHEDLKSFYQSQERDKNEAKALEAGLSFINLEGEIGCMVNGAGLAMATMDMIRLYGGRPANFLDVGGGAEESKVKKAFEIILQSPKVKSVLINIFGGIMQCDVIAKALIKAVEKSKTKLPLVVRLEGTRAREGRELLKNSSLDFITAGDFDSAAKKAVEAAEKYGYSDR